MNYIIYFVILYFIGCRLQNKIFILTLNMKHAIYSVILRYIGLTLQNKK